MSMGEEEKRPDQDPETQKDDPSKGFPTGPNIGSLTEPEVEPKPSEGFETAGLLEGDTAVPSVSDGFPTNFEVKGLDHLEALPPASEGFGEKSET